MTWIDHEELWHKHQWFLVLLVCGYWKLNYCLYVSVVWPSVSLSNFFKTFSRFYCQAYSQIESYCKYSALLIRWNAERMQPCILLCASVTQKWENYFPIPACMISRLLQDSLKCWVCQGVYHLPFIYLFIYLQIYLKMGMPTTSKG